MLAIVLYVLAIIACGGAGAAAGWFVSGALGFTGAFGALSSAVIAMVVAVALWAAFVALSDRLRR